MKLKVLNPNGIHEREVKGLSVLKDALPEKWYGYASLELIGNNGGEIDLVICADDRLIAVEIKDWNGRIEDLGSIWRTSGRDQKSPVVAIAEKSKKLASRLRNFLAPEHQVPWVDHCVLLTGKSRRSDLSNESKEKTFELDYFKGIGGRDTFKKSFPHPAWSQVPISELKPKLDVFFSGPRVRPLSRSYNGYKASDDACYTHPKRIYSEFFAEKEGAKGFRALLRRWDFQELGNVDAAYLNRENFAALALREENAIGYLKDAKPEFADRNVFLTPISNEGRDAVTINFFELYDLPQNLSRLKEALRRFGSGLKDDNRISLARLLLSHFAELHDLQVTHRDLGDHCIWVNIPDKVSLSGFATCSFPEQKTIAQIRETIRAGTERIPEDLLDLRSDNYRKDVFLLATVIHQILLGEKPVSEDSVPTWKDPETTKFKQFWGWFERCLDLDPSKRFPDAKAAFDEFQRCDKKPAVTEVSEDAFREFAGTFLPQPKPGDTVLRDDSHGVTFRSAEIDGENRLIKIWPNARFESGKPATNFHLLEFFQRIRSLSFKDLSGQQRILKFGLTRFGSFVELKWEEGATLDRYDFSNYQDDAALSLVCSLVEAVAQMHRADYYHGDLKPANILVVENGENLSGIRLVDVIDFASPGTERRSSAYLPPEGETAATPACDGYALGKIVTAFLFDRMGLVSSGLKEKISNILNDMLDPDGGIPDLSGALEELTAVDSEDDGTDQTSGEELVMAMGGIDGDILMRPDDRGLPITIYPDRDNESCFILNISDSEMALSIRLDAEQAKIVGLWVRPYSLMDFIRDLNRQTANLRRPLRILKGVVDELTPLEGYIKEAGLFNEIARRHAAIKFSKPPVAPVEIPKDAGIEGESDVIVEEVSSVPLSDLWEALLDAEASIVPIVTVTGEPVEIPSSNILVVPVGEPTMPLEPQDDERVQVETKDREGGWRYYGELDNRRTRGDRLAVVPRVKGSFRLKNGDSLRLENKASRASYDKRLAAVQRILKRESVCSELIRYLSCEQGQEARGARFTTRFGELGKYGLNAVQEDALKTALTASPLSMIQGPPGTGKTNVISAAVHYIATNYPTARILVVSQSHEAIDHATEQIVKRFRAHDKEPSLVRVGRRASVSDNLISFHSESLQGEYRERFRLSMTQRIAPMGRRLGLSEGFVQEMAILRSRVVSLLRQLGPEAKDGERDDPVVLRSLQKACRQLDPEFEFESVPITSVCGIMEQRLSARHQETDDQAVNTLRRIIDLALEWIQILEAPGKLDRFYVRSCQIVTGTCVGVGRWDLGLEGENFDCVIIDEAARCGPGDLAVASQVGEQVILLGDHKQLPPFMEKEVIDRVVSELGCQRRVVERSDFQRLFASDYAANAGRTLRTQYRMREPIGRLVSECFYPDTGGLECGRKSSSACYDRLPISLDHNVTWIDSGDGGEERVRTSFVNRHEIDRIMEMLVEIDSDKKLVEDLASDAKAEAMPAAIGIIAAYKAQAEAIEERLWASSLSPRLRSTCKIGTVDSYQGKENPIVIFSAVRCNRHDEIGFTRSWERMNVSLSRARERLVIVGSWRFWESAGAEAPLGKVAQFLAGRVAESDSGYSLKQSVE